MSFLHRVASLSLRDRVKSSVILEGLGVEPLLLHIKRSQFSWFGQLVRMPPQGGVSSMFNWKKTLTQTQGSLQRLCHLGQGTPQFPPVRDEGGC